MTLTQENRMLVIATPFGDDVVVLTRFSGTEGISIPFSFGLDLESEDNDLAFEDIIGENVTVSIGREDEDRRFFNGIISRFAQDTGGGQTERGRRLACYSAKMVPWFWLLTRSTNSRIFQELSVPDIVEQIFTEKGFLDYRMDLGSYEPREYCVQYNETDFNFVSRLLEQEGIFYFFEHENGKHTMVLADAPDRHSPCPNHESVRYHPVTGNESPMEGVIVDLDRMREIRIGKYTVNDFNFESPNTDLKVEAVSQNSLGPEGREFYDYPAEYTNRSDGETLANIRLQAEEARATTITGLSACKGFSSGYKFELTGYYREEMNDQNYVLVSVSHDASEPAGGSDERVGSSYANRFTCIPFDVPYRPPLITPKPMIAGVQTAIVVGPSGEEIHTDGHGRVKVQFHWDRARQYNENSSCFIRVSQPWAGAGWGSIFLPRIGQEVIVSFLESDPDRPIITGRVYNGLNMPPYPLPDEKTKSTIKSMSSPDSGGVNEIRFEDKSGEEQLFIQAESTLDIRTKGVCHEFVGGKRHLIVKEDQLEKVEGDKHLTVVGDHKEKVNGVFSLSVGGDVLQTMTNYAIETAMYTHIKAGTTLLLEAQTGLELRVGGSSIVLTPGSVFISGPTVFINSGSGPPAVLVPCNPAPPDPPEEPGTTEPGSTSEVPILTPAEQEAVQITPQAIAFQQAADSGRPYVEC